VFCRIFGINKAVKELENKLKKLSVENDELRAQIKLYQAKVDFLIRKLYGGGKSEKLDSSQLELLLSGLAEDGSKKAGASGDLSGLAEADEKSRGRKKRRSKEPQLPENIEVVEEVIEPEPVKACPRVWRRIGEEVSEQLDYQPGKFFKRRLIRPRYVRINDKDTAPVIADLPAKLQERGKLAPGLLAHIVVSKYADHLPLYRQEQIYDQRHGVKIPRQLMARGVGLVAESFQLVAEQMAREMFTGSYVQVDETPVKYLVPGTGRAQQGYFWAINQPGGDVLYHWFSSRAHTCLEKIIPKGFAGWLQCDGYPAYRTFARKRDNIELVGCWTHARRKFNEALEQKSVLRRAAWVMRQIRHLYRIESELRSMNAGPRLRDAFRASQSLPVARRIHRALLRFKTRGGQLPQSPFGKAMNYFLNQWELLERCLLNGDVEVDNNLVENAIRPTAIGKKNWLFIGSDDAGWHSAVIYSIIVSCRNHGIDPYEYMSDVLTRLPNMTNHQIPSITPKAWAAEKAKAETLTLAA